MKILYIGDYEKLEGDYETHRYRSVANQIAVFITAMILSLDSHYWSNNGYRIFNWAQLF